MRTGTDETSKQGARDAAVTLGSTVLGRYRVVDACATGGFGTVLTCWDTRLQRRVAIKRIPVAPSNAAGSTMSDALAEARTASLLAHGNIVAVYDFESDASFAYLVMEYVDGLTVAELVQRVEGGKLTGDEVSYIVSAVADALAYAHENGVLHLDIKPSNIMIDSAGNVKLCDFGMATLASAAGYGGARGGTVGYMPPEQISGDYVDERTDVFSLAVVVWQMLTGSSPFEAPSATASLKLIRKGARSPLSAAVSGVDPAVDEVMAQALSPEPASRVSSARGFARKLAAKLGNVKAGRQSISQLLAQATGDEDGEATTKDRLPIAFRHPWLPGAITRGGAALLTALATATPAAWLLAPHATPAATLAVVAAAATVAALWPPAGSMLAVFALLAAIASPPTTVEAVMVPGTMALMTTVWWANVSRRDDHATAALLAPVVLRAPAASAAIAGYHLPPARAAITTACAWLVATLHAAATAVGFDAPATATALVGVMAKPASWLSLVGAATAAAATAAVTGATLTHKGTVVAQVVGASINVMAQLTAATMENSGLVAAPTWSSVGVAVVLCIAMGFVTVVFDATTDEEGA